MLAYLMRQLLFIPFIDQRNLVDASSLFLQNIHAPTPAWSSNEIESSRLVSLHSSTPHHIHQTAQRQQAHRDLKILRAGPSKAPTVVVSVVVVSMPQPTTIDWLAGGLFSIHLTMSSLYSSAELAQPREQTSRPIHPSIHWSWLLGVNSNYYYHRSIHRD